jgi:2-(1,2-epoxy-1,2-dihydrophenyl)acetyl-CoA isomerase
MVLGYEVSDGVAVITFDRPDVLNAFDDELGNAALEAVERAAGDPQVRCMVITGSGRAFSSGEDLGALKDGYERGEAPPLGDTLVNRYNPLIRAIRAAPKPVVAALNGVAAGAGVSIALACDFRIASENAKLALAFTKVGLVPDSGAVWFLTKIVGAAKALEISTLGESLSADKCLRLGLVTQVVPAGAFDHQWRVFASQLAGGPTRAYALTKELANRAPERSLDEELEAEVEAQTEAGATKDHLEGVQAFFEKRSPDFSGS